MLYNGYEVIERMKINEVEKLTGLTKKAIRLYEDRGLITVSRSENGYRDYSYNDIGILKQIKLLRTAGVSLTDIKLLFTGMLSIDDLVEKRKKEIETESGLSSEQYTFCGKLAEHIANGDTVADEPFTENCDTGVREHGALAVGMDIGTTTISAAVVDIESKKQLEVFTIPHNSYTQSSSFSEQSVSAIMKKTEGLIALIFRSYSNIVSIGVTGQMHGIVYLNGDGEAVSDLINWQDKRADIPLGDGLNTCALIKKLTGESISTGYGIATHYYNMLNGLVPENAVGFCSIMDHFAMRLCNVKKPPIHTSVAASFGFFDADKGCFKLDKLALLGVDKAFLPSVTARNETVGSWNGIPVFVAIGDTQASVLGSVKNNRESLLINIGTGSQVLAVGDSGSLGDDIECRPLINGEKLVCGAALCGGSAYALMESFFRSYAEAAGMGDISQYSTLNALAKKAYESGEQPLSVNTAFCGKRSDSLCRGAIENIELNSFTPSALILGVISGMCDELYGLYGALGIEKSHIVASGGAIRKNSVLRKVLEDRFCMTVSVCSVKEEAATGAALYSAYALDLIEYKNGFPDFIKYVEREDIK
ncbi:MAG: MerR family transcriptional regulator [Ruminococcaceae bacterium]|nr:MerR family transcriptional regulator [Oscillospiraceae bacterium]